MAEEMKKFLDHTGLTAYDEKIKKVISDGDADTLQNAKDYADGLADNYDAAGSATTAEDNAKAYTDELANGAVKTNTGNIAEIKKDVGTLDNLDTTAKTDIVSAINEVRNSVSAGGTAAAVTMDTSIATEGALKSYTIKQGDNTVGVIDIPKDMVVESGEVVTNPAGQAEGTYIKLVLANVTEPLYINVGTLVDIYKAKASATQVQVAIDSSTREISATIVAGSIGTTELGTNAVTTEKIADANVTKSKLSNEVQTSLGKADAAAPQTALDAEIEKTEDIDERLKTVEGLVGEGGSVDSKIATAKSEAISEATSTAAGDATTKANTAESNAKSYADGLIAEFTPITTGEIEALFA